MLRWMKTVVMLLAVAAVAGCGASVKELGPADASKVPAVDADKVKQQMDEAKKHMPANARIPNSVVPSGPGAPGAAPSK